MAEIRVYADTSVYGGVFDEEFAEASRTFFDQVGEERFRLVLSPIVGDELEGAPDSVRALFEELRRVGEAVNVTEESVRLQQAYLDANIVDPKEATWWWLVGISLTWAGLYAGLDWCFPNLELVEVKGQTRYRRVGRRVVSTAGGLAVLVGLAVGFKQLFMD